ALIDRSRESTRRDDARGWTRRGRHPGQQRAIDPASPRPGRWWPLCRDLARCDRSRPEQVATRRLGCRRGFGMLAAKSSKPCADREVKMDAILVEGPTVDSLYPTSERCKQLVATHYGPAIPLNQPIADMLQTLKRLREEGFEVEVREQGGY